MIDLPSTPAPNGASPGLVDFGGFLTPGLGGEVQRVNRLGNRFMISATFPPMPSADTGRIFVSRLIRGKTEGLRMDYPLLSFDPGNPGTLVVDGAGQAGSTLLIRGGIFGQGFVEGQFFSIERADGRHYLHMVTANTALDGAGKAALPITPMLRYQFADGAACHFTQPKIEGFVLGDEWRWQMSLERLLSIEFELRERA